MSLDPFRGRLTWTTTTATVPSFWAGIAGLLAARVLAGHYAEVLVVDRDELATASGPRRGTPQARHVHGLLARGQGLLEELFPGLTAELVAAGAPIGDMLEHTRLCFGGHRFAPGPSGLTMLCLSRPMLEQAVRRRVADLPVVRLLGGRDVVGIVSEAGDRRVAGARVIRRVNGSAEEELRCDLVVDATGRGSRLPVWLEPLGFPGPPVERMHVGVGYASRQFRLPSGVLGDDLAVLSGPTPDRPRGGAVSLIEDGRCLVTLMGMLGDHPPTDLDGFVRFATDLAIPDLCQVLRDAEPLDEGAAYRHPTSTHRRYDRMRRLPDGLVALGDSVCSLNPIYGQGMTVAALETVALGRQLDRGPLDPRRFQHAVGRISSVAWAMSTGGDLSFPEVDGRRTPATRTLGRFVTRVQASATRDPALGRAFLRVTAMVDHPRALLRPSVLTRLTSASSTRSSRPTTGPSVTPPAPAHSGDTAEPN